MNKLNLLNKIKFIIIGFLFTISTSAQVGQIIWEENFTTLETTIWTNIEGDGGYGNFELQYYQEDNVYIENIEGEEGNSALVLEARKEAMGDSQFTSGKITSQNKIGIKYGMIETRIKVPDDLSTGLWPAAWLLGTNISALGWPACGEMDIMEMGQSAKFREDKGLSNSNENDIVGANLIFFSDDACSDENSDCAASISFDNYYCKPYRGETPLNDRFLIYRMYWDDQAIRFTVEDNGQVQNLYTGPFPIGSDAKEFTKPFDLILNLAVGGNFTDASTAAQVSAELPGKMLIDYIRVRKWNGKGEVFTPEKLMPNAGADITIPEGETLELNASGSYGNINSYSWSINDSIIADVIKANVALAVGTHEITLTITDQAGNSASDNISVTVGSSAIGEVIWKDDFNAFDTTFWKTSIGDGCDEGNCGWGNNELQYYNDDNISIEEMEEESGNFALVIEARKETMGEKEFTSGKVTTEDRVAIKQGVVEVRMKVPDLENGLWPAAWLLGSNHRTAGWPTCGEIDMMEMGQSLDARHSEDFYGSPNNYVGGNVIWYSSGACSSGNQSCAASIANDGYYYTPYISSQAMNDRYVTYRMYWDDSEIRLCAVDNGTEYDLYTNPFPLGATGDVFQKPFYFILDLAVGGNFTGLLNNSDITAPVPAKMYIDYVKVNKWQGKGEVAIKSRDLMADAGADVSVTDLDKDGKQLITLDGLSSYGKINSYEWSENGIVVASGPTPSVELTAGTHVILLTIADENGNTSSDDVKIEIREILWEDNFNAFETGAWNKLVGDGCPDECGWGNAELEYYQENNVYIESIEGEEGNSALVLEARKEQVGNSAFTSGKITTENKVSIKYGLIEVRMKVPNDISTGLWPAAWLLGTNISEVGWPKCGEIDMMEMGQNTQFRYDKGHESASENDLVGANLIFHSDNACSGDNPNCAASIAYDNYYCNPYVNEAGITNRFLIYRTYWDQNQIRLTAEDNGVEYDLYTGPFPLGADAEEFHKPFYFILNLAVGGNFTDAATAGQVTAALPGKMLVDYVRVLKWNGKGEVAFENGIIAKAGSDIIKLDEDGDGKETIILDASESAHHNGEIVSYSWKNNGFEIATGKTASIELNRGTHTIELTVTDKEGNTGTDKVLVTISSGGLAPLANAGNDTTIYLTAGSDKTTIELDASASEESNSPLIAYKWFENDVEIASDIKPSVELKAGIHLITLNIMDQDSLVGTDDIAITVIDPNNKLPVSNAGTSIVVEDDNGDDLVDVTLDGSGSTDSDGTIESYTWSINQKTIAEGVNPAVELSTGIYTIKLEVIDNLGGMAFSQVSATIIDPDNIAPIAVAGKDIVVVDTDRSGSEKYKLDASQSSDNDGSIVSYSWNVNNSLIVSGVKPTVDFALGENTVYLKISDDDGVLATDTVTITVSQLPIAKAGTDTLVVDNDADGVETVELNASESSDPDGSILSYSWLLDNTEIATGQIASYGFSKGTNTVTLLVIDNVGLKATDEVVVTVKSLTNTLPIANAGDDIFAEDADNNGQETVELDGALSSDEDGSIFEYKWFENDDLIATGATPSVLFVIGDHLVILEVTDNEGDIATDDVYVTITQSACKFVACTGDFVAKVVSNDEETTVKFIPNEFGTGESTCLFFYGTADPMGANTAIPYEAFKLSGVSAGQTIYFYYTYNTNNGSEQTTFACKDNFVVGGCNAPNTSDPIADAGDKQTLIDTDNNGSEEVTLDASESYDSDGTIDSYSWIKDNTKIASTVNPTVSLAKGSHSIDLLVTDDAGNVSRDKVTIEVKAPSDILDVNPDINLRIYPQPVSDILKVECQQGIIESIMLYNLQGKKIAEVKSSTIIDMGDFSEGLYLVEVTINGNSHLRKVMKK
jgi:beta-glucanase (GH16 family)